MGDLPNLRLLFLAENSISEIPKELEKLEKLEELKLDDNTLEILPPEIFTIPTMRRYFLNNNKLKTIPKEAANLPELRFIEIKDNPLLCLPQEIWDARRNGEFLVLSNAGLEDNDTDCSN